MRDVKVFHCHYFYSTFLVHAQNIIFRHLAEAFGNYIWSDYAFSRDQTHDFGIRSTMSVKLNEQFVLKKVPALIIIIMI